MVAVAVCAAALAVSAQAATPAAKAKPAPKLVKLDKAYFAGKLVNLHSVPAQRGGRTLVVGPFNLGEKISPGNNDFRPNLYFVCPGSQQRVEGHPEFDHNVVLSSVPKDESNFDVYWVVVLDPSVQEDFTSEQQIIVATQATFTPPENFSLDQVPSIGFLRTFLKVNDMDGLEKFKRPDGELPRVAIVPAKITVRAVAEEIEEPEATQVTATGKSDETQ